MKYARGVSLIELMTVVGIVAILGVLAVGSYRNYGLRTNRTEGQTALLRIQVGEEKFFLQNNSYTLDIVGLPPAGLGIGNTSTNGYYTLTVVPGTTGTIATSFIATATAAGTQATDTAACRVLTIDDQGQRQPNDASGCWK
jgi:type IV pilus assembly protein PilE